jgi:hypothetical protein
MEIQEEIEKLDLNSIDKDIADLFAESGSGTFAIRLPMQIHVCRYLKKISEQLTLVSKVGSGD